MFCSVLLLIVLSCCSAEDFPPSIRLNSKLLRNRSEPVLTAGSTFTLSCTGNGSVRWSTTAFRLLYRDELPNPLRVENPQPRHTGTYRCRSSNRGLEHLHTWIHLYVTDPSDPSSVFVSPRGEPPQIREGEDFLYKCLLTDPSLTNLTFRPDHDARGRGRGLPRGMNVTFDPQRGAMIHNMRLSFRGRYVCSGWRDGREFKSRPVNLLVRPRPPPPSLSVSQVEFVRLEGERFEVTCLTSNPSHFYNVTWTHSHMEALNVSVSRLYSNNRLHMNVTVSVAAVTHAHGGRYRCTATNEAGVATATTRLQVVDGPYLIIYLQPREHANANFNTSTVENKGKLVANMMTSAVAVNGEPVANVSKDRIEVAGAGCANVSVSRRVEVHEGQDVMLTLVMEAYPPISYQRWTTPTGLNSSYTAYEESYAANGYGSEASLLLRQIRQEDRGLYVLRFSSSSCSGSQEVNVRIYRSPKAVLQLENNTLSCSGSGYPLPRMLWYICPGVRQTCGDSATYQVSADKEEEQAGDEEEEEEVWEHVTLPPSAGDDVTVECVAFSRTGVSRDVFISHQPQQFFTPALIGAWGVGVALFLLLLVVLYKWKQKPKYEIRWKIIESTDGNNYTFVDPAHLPYSHTWEFPRDKLRLGAVLGSGAFGKVVEATAYGLGPDNNVTRVAVKMLKPSAHSVEREALMSELKILSHLGYHDNIVNLLGACTHGGPMLMITEYCRHGDLLNFLRAHAQEFLAAILSMAEGAGQAFYKNTGSRQRSDSGISCCSEYQELQPMTSSGQKHLSVQTDGLSVGDLMMFSYQVAQGLEFLSTKNCIHRDVAARNVLLTDHRVAKICDFGLARDIRNDDSYIVQGNARLPVKWMAPESIFQCVYTVQSDVWSYGVLLWEIFSLGKSPYPNVAVDTNFYKMIKDGRHMDQPDFAPPEMYQLMIGCWSLEPTDRPTFKAIGQLVKQLLPSTNDVSPSHGEQPTYKNLDECREEEEEEELMKSV